MADTQSTSDDPYTSRYKQIGEFVQTAVDESRGISALELANALELVLDDLKKLVTGSTKNDASRETVKKGQVEMEDGVTYGINQEFIEMTIQLSDDLMLDELEAANLIWKGQEIGPRVDRAPPRAALILYHTRQQALLSLILSIFTLVDDDRVADSKRAVLEDFASRLAGGKREGRDTSGTGETYFKVCLRAMEFLRSFYHSLQQKEQHAITLNANAREGWDEFIEDTHLQKRSISHRHETLALILSELIDQRRVIIGDFRALIAVYTEFQHYNIHIVHHLAPTYAFISEICATTDTPFLDFREVINLHRDLKKAKESPWPLKSLQAAVWIWWLSNLNGLCSEHGDDIESTGMDYQNDMATPVNTALSEGGFEFMLSLTSGLCRNLELDANRDEVRDFLMGKTKLKADYDLLSPEYLTKITANLELFVDSFITNMADTLKELKIKEEEHMLLQSGEKSELDLERFFFVIAFLFYGRKDAATTFWTNQENNLHGFLVWASQKQNPLMTTIYCYMLASLSFGEESAAACFEFLTSDAIPGTAKSRRTNFLSWDGIMKGLREFTLQLNGGPKQQLIASAAAPYSRQPPQDQTSEPSLEVALTIDSYIRLISRLARESGEAREQLLNLQVPVLEQIFNLLDSRVPLQLLPSIFQAISSFLVDKSPALNTAAWNAIDEWAFALPKLPANALTVTSRASKNLDVIVNAIHPANSFIQLLVALVLPSPEAGPLKDELPFPETLGTSIRTSGIDPYVDFVMKDIFVGTLWEVFGSPKEIKQNVYSLTHSIAHAVTPVKPDLQDPNTILRTEIQLTCLQFVRACLEAFNDELIIYSTTTNVAVDYAMASTSLLAYAKLHPFARVMEHLLSEKVIRVLFEILDFGAAVLPECLEGSPVIDLVHETIEVLDLAINLQTTYVDVVRKLIKEDESAGRPGFTMAGFDRFEDIVLYHLELIINLCLFAGMNFTAITEASLRLLEQLIVSPRLIDVPEWTLGRQVRVNRVLNAVQTSDQSQQVIFAFIELMRSTSNDPDAMAIKLKVLHLLEKSLDASGSEPSLAHLLLGFECNSNGIELSLHEGGIGSGVSLFHTILEIASSITGYEPNGDMYEGAELELKEACFGVLRRLWKGSQTWEDTRHVLRANEFFFAQFIQESPISTSTIWLFAPDEGYPYEKPEFFTTPAAQCCYSFLRRRACLFDYVAAEIWQLKHQGAATILQKYLSSLLGVTPTPDGNVQNVHILSLLDFLELETPKALVAPRSDIFQDVILSSCITNGIYDLERVRSVLLLKKNEVMKQGLAQAAEDEINLLIEGIVNFLFVQNQHRTFLVARLECLRSWSQLVGVMLEACDFTIVSKMSFILQALQTILPKLEVFSSSDVDSAQHLSSLAHQLISHVVFDQKTFGKGKASDLASDRLYQLFRISLRCVQTPHSSPALRQDFYNIAYLYLKGMQDVTADGRIAQRHSTQSIKASGDRLLEVVCNDAYAGEGSCKIVALLLLESIAALAASEGSTFVIDTLNRQNFFVVLIDSIKHVGEELEAAEAGAVSSDVVMLSFKAKASFLLRVAETRVGAGYLLNAGLLHAVRESKIFSVDPDIGFGIGGPDSLAKYYQLLLAITRVITSCIVSRGPQNKQALDMGRGFLADTRSVAASVFKKHLNIGGPSKDGEGVEELTNLFVMLMEAVGFVEMEQGAY